MMYSRYSYPVRRDHHYHRLLDSLCCFHATLTAQLRLHCYLRGCQKECGLVPSTAYGWPEQDCDGSRTAAEPTSLERAPGRPNSSAVPRRNRELRGRQTLGHPVAAALAWSPASVLRLPGLQPT